MDLTRKIKQKRGRERDRKKQTYLTNLVYKYFDDRTSNKNFIFLVDKKNQTSGCFFFMFSCYTYSCDTDHYSNTFNEKVELKTFLLRL